MSAVASVGPPLWLLFELTYRCPLQCVFCYNPLDYASIEQELETEHWLRVLREARALGAVQLGLSGGEPLMRADLEVITAEAHRLGYYTNLITSGIGLTEQRIRNLKAAGLDHIQLSFQDSTREVNDFLSHTRTFDLKKRAGDLIKAYGFPMVVNCVIHRLNIDHIGAIIEMAADLEAEYLELANTQYYSWAFMNRQQLLPSRAQLVAAEQTTNDWRTKLGDRMKLFFVVPDYYETRPKRCVNGWGSTLMVVTPEGAALPCHTAKMLPGLQFPNVREDSVENIWRDSPAFNHFRGTSWMKEPCASCDEREKDLGGCRCQAYLIAQDAAAADPVCSKSAHHALVTDVVDAAQHLPSEHVVHGARETKREHPLVFRDIKSSRALSAKN